MSEQSIQIETVIKQPDGTYALLADAANPFDVEPEGIFKIWIGETVLIDESSFDYLIDLWMYLISKTVALLDEQESQEIWFPDQPLVLTLEPLSPELLKLTFGTQRAPKRMGIVLLRDFLREVANGGDEFFRRWIAESESETEKKNHFYLGALARIRERVQNR